MHVRYACAFSAVLIALLCKCKFIFAIAGARCSIITSVASKQYNSIVLSSGKPPARDAGIGQNKPALWEMYLH